MKLALKSGSKTVTTAGTSVALVASSTWARGLRLAAPAGNAGAVYLGDSGVASTNGLALAPGDIVSFTEIFGVEDGAVNLANVYVDAATNGDKVTFAYLEPVS
jgi:hypothetical protein